MSIGDDNFHSPNGNGGWWSRMSRHEQIVAALIGAIVTGLFGIFIALISSSAGASHAGTSNAAGAARPSSEPSGALAGSSSAPTVNSPTASAVGTMAAPPSPTPSPDQVAQDSSHSPPTPQSNLQYLADLNSVANLGAFETGNAQVNGNNYLNSVILDMALGGSYSVSYDTGRHWRTLEATVGLRDDSPQNEEYEFQVFADGNPIYSHLLTLGQSRYMKLNITGVLRIELRATLSSSAFYGEAYGVWGNAELIR